MPRGRSSGAGGRLCRRVGRAGPAGNDASEEPSCDKCHTVVRSPARRPAKILPPANLEKVTPLQLCYGYGPPRRESDRRSPSYVKKILDGSNPADLPVEQPSLIENVDRPETRKNSWNPHTGFPSWLSLTG